MNRIESMLDDALFHITTARELNAVLDRWPNVMISGLPGSGKTAITKAWAEDNGILLAPYDLGTDVTAVYEEDAGGILCKKAAEDPVAVAKALIYDTLIRYKDGGDLILLLDDYHRATKENLEAVFYTMDTHKIVNPATGEEVFLENLLFAVAIRTEM